MSSPADEWDSTTAREALEHPLRQTLFALLSKRPASAVELQQAVAQSLGTLNYHLGVLVQRGCLIAESWEGSAIYRVEPRAERMFPPPAARTSRFVILSLLDAAWTTSGKSGSPRWQIFELDEPGLHAASGVMAKALEQIKAIADASKETAAESQPESPVHILVAVASFSGPPQASAEW